MLKSDSVGAKIKGHFQNTNNGRDNRIKQNSSTEKVYKEKFTYI